MSPGSTRKKPICQKCGLPMAGHKRPHGIPVCPGDESAPPSPSPQPGPAPAPARLRRHDRLPAPDFAVQPSASGYWHRANPNWVEPESYANQSRPLDNIPQRRPSAQSWVTTEHDGRSQGTPARRQGARSPPPVPEVIDVDAEDEQEGTGYGYGGCKDGTVAGSPGPDYDYDQDYEQEHYEHEEYIAEEPEDDSDTASNASSVTILKRMGRRISQVLGRSTPLASLYASPRDHVAAITSAAQAEGLYTRAIHRPGDDMGIKDEPSTPMRMLRDREHSWMIAVGRDRGAVDALLDSAATPPRPTVRLQPDGMVEPYDYDRGLNRERNERVGSYPDDPRWIRNTFFDILVAGAVGGFVVFYCLSSF